MSDLYLNRPIITGTPQIGQKPQTGAARKQEAPETSFQQALQEQMAAQRSLTFSKHAAQRVNQRGIDIPDSSMARLHEGVRLAAEKGLKNDALILVDQVAFLVNVQNGKVITTMGSEDMRGSVFTNIDGTVII